mgnify:CR=1 FL=1
MLRVSYLFTGHAADLCLLTDYIYTVCLFGLLGRQIFHAFTLGQIATVNANVRTILAIQIFLAKGSWLYEVCRIVNIIRVPN